MNYSLKESDKRLKKCTEIKYNKLNPLVKIFTTKKKIKRSLLVAD